MSATPPDHPPAPEVGPNGWTETEALNALDFFFDAVGDTTIRPMRSPVLRQIRPDQPPQAPKANP